MQDFHKKMLQITLPKKMHKLSLITKLPHCYHIEKIKINLSSDRIITKVNLQQFPTEINRSINLLPYQMQELKLTVIIFV